jgi:dipeptidyl aminopeptidase/acylaminoacyl peptidase
MGLLRIAVLSMLFAASADAQEAVRRPLSPADLLAIERVDEVVPSPDGNIAAVVVLRARTSAATTPGFLMSGYDRADVWLVHAAEGDARVITDGARDGTGFYFPTWSPDGTRLALLSTRGGGLTVWVWDATTRALRQVARRNVEHARPVWRTSTRLLCAGPPDGQAPTQLSSDTAYARQMLSAWPRAFEGRGTTASVLRSGGRPPEDDPRLRGELLEFDVTSGVARVLASGAFTGLSVSSDGRWLAAARASSLLRPTSPDPLPNVNPVRYDLALFALEEAQMTTPSVEDIVPTSIRWLPEVDRLRLSRHDRHGGSPRTVHLAREQAVFREVDAAGVAQASDDVAGLPVDVPSPPTVVWRQDGAPVRVIRQGTGPGATWLLQDLPAGALRPMAVPPGTLELVAFSPRHSTAYLRDVSRTGTRLYAARPGGAEPRLLLERNTFLASVTEGSLRHVQVPTPDGSTSSAWLLLPPGAPDGRKHPTVVWVYGGLVYGPSPPPFFVPLNSPATLNLQVLAARGYAVLLPSVPLGPEGTAAEPLTEIGDAVLRAVDAAIASGDVDGTRVAVMGHSFGGYAALGLVTHTNRFRAAVAMAGASNLVSLYGQFDTRFRHLPSARERLLAMVFTESGQYRMGAPPTHDLQRYVRNSPVSHAHRVSTPTMIIQGDLDYVPIQQGEEFFTALYRRGVRAEFVRYWGEGHTIESPPNILDMWARIVAWLDAHLLG